MIDLNYCPHQVIYIIYIYIFIKLSNLKEYLELYTDHNYSYRCESKWDFCIFCMWRCKGCGKQAWCAYMWNMGYCCQCLEIRYGFFSFCPINADPCHGVNLPRTGWLWNRTQQFYGINVYVDKMTKLPLTFKNCNHK